MNQDQLKQAVAQAAIDFIIPKLSQDSILGIGTGSTANFFIAGLAKYRDCFAAAVASSQASEERLTALGIQVIDLNEVNKIAIYVDGADESNGALELIKGGGAALTREKIVAAASETFVCIADANKMVTTLGKFPLPVEVIPMAREYVARKLSALGGRPVWRQGVVTDNGGHILDVHDWKIENPKALEASINEITGVITNGLFARRGANVLLLGTPDGVETRLPQLR